MVNRFSRSTPMRPFATSCHSAGSKVAFCVASLDRKVSKLAGVAGLMPATVSSNGLVSTSLTGCFLNSSKKVMFVR